MAKTGKCFLCAAPSKETTSGASRERCEACSKKSNRAASAKWRAKNKDRVRAAQKTWRDANVDRRMALNEAWKKRNPERHQAIRRKDHLKRSFGITPEQFDSMVAEQGGRCAICDTDDSGAKAWRVDHDHCTGSVRGLLCNACNVGLGAFRDHPGHLLAAERYLKLHQRKHLSVVHQIASTGA